MPRALGLAGPSEGGRPLPTPGGRLSHRLPRCSWLCWAPACCVPGWPSSLDPACPRLGLLHCWNVPSGPTARGPGGGPGSRTGLTCFHSGLCTRPLHQEDGPGLHPGPRTVLCGGQVAVGEGLTPAHPPWPPAPQLCPLPPSQLGEARDRAGSQRQGRRFPGEGSFGLSLGLSCPPAGVPHSVFSPQALSQAPLGSALPQTRDASSPLLSGEL